MARRRRDGPKWRQSIDRRLCRVASVSLSETYVHREAALLFSQEGASVVVADVSREAGAKTAGECRDAVFVEVDVSDPTSVTALYEAAARRFGGVDVLYNNAGIMPADDDSILTTEADAWDRVQAVNSKGVFLCCKFGIPLLLQRGGATFLVDGGLSAAYVTPE